MYSNTNLNGLLYHPFLLHSCIYSLPTSYLRLPRSLEDCPSDAVWVLRIKVNKSFYQMPVNVKRKWFVWWLARGNTMVSKMTLGKGASCR